MNRPDLIERDPELFGDQGSRIGAIGYRRVARPANGLGDHTEVIALLQDLHAESNRSIDSLAYLAPDLYSRPDTGRGVT